MRQISSERADVDFRCWLDVECRCLVFLGPDSFKDPLLDDRVLQAFTFTRVEIIIDDPFERLTMQNNVSCGVEKRFDTCFLSGNLQRLCLTLWFLFPLVARSTSF